MQLPEAGSYARTAINFLVFSVFVIFLHFQQEKIDRRMFTLRTQLKISYRALQKSQIAEKKASNSKKRFISYIFHEVRVPLNTAYLAFQNLQQTNGFNRQDEDQMVEVYALESSLQQVQQVLNDVLE
jgi:signal transduction histidine kinase